MLKIITLNIGYLFRTVVVRNENNLDHFEEIAADSEGFDIPAIGAFNKDPNHNKWFTPLPVYSYGDYWTNNDYAFLQYTVKKPLKLIDRPDNFSLSITIEYIEREGLDGYIGKEDTCEIYIHKPLECLHQAIIQLPVFPYLETTDKIFSMADEYELKYIVQNCCEVSESSLFIKDKLRCYGDSLTNITLKKDIHLPTPPLTSSLFGISKCVRVSDMEHHPYKHIIDMLLV